MNFFKKNFGLILIVLFWLGIVVTNFSPDTFLSGWDNLHPEFNFSINLKRALFSSWQEYQGLGLLGGMGHGADLFRQIILWVTSLILPVNFIRYFFHFSMLLTGALGIYFLLKDFILEKSNESSKRWGSLGGAVFYLFNLGMLQMFYLPFEVFSTHFGFLPWLFWGVFQYLKEPSKKNLLLFILINILMVSQGYVATVFVVYVMALVLVLIGYGISKVGREGSFDSGSINAHYSLRMTKRIIFILFVTFCVNAFWLLPNLYFVFNDVGTNTGAKINLMSTENNLLLNKKYGNFKDVLLLKGFWFENVELQTDGTTDYIMEDWVNYLDKPLVKGLGYGLFGLSILGIFFAIKTKNKKALLFIPVFLLSFTFLANSAFGFSFLNNLLYKLPLFSQIFRFPFTKFSILIAFCLAIFYGVLVGKVREMRVFRVMGLVIILLPIVFLFPVFQEKLFYSKEKAKIPSEYFEVFEFFKTQDKNTRIANFPQPTFWGWTNYKWGEQLYSGSGFLWYGIQQPILDRAFDVWSKQNENYYWEMSYALYSKNIDLFENVLEKYQINWILVDGNMINPGAEKAIFLEEIETLLQDNRNQDNSEQSTGQDNRNQESINSQRKKFELTQTFGKIKIYKVNLETPVKDFVYLAKNLPVINDYEWGNYDEGFGEYGGYVSVEERDSSTSLRMTEVYYPFRSLFTGRKTDELEIDIEDLGDKIVFKASLLEGLENYVIELPKNYEGKELVEIDPNTYETKYFIPTVDVIESRRAGEQESKNLEITVTFPKVKGLLSAEIEPAKDETSFYLSDLSHKYAYLISVQAKNISGKPFLFWLENLTNRKADQELYLDQKSNIKDQNQNSKLKTYSEGLTITQPLLSSTYLIQPPMAEDGLGYSLHFDNISIGKKETINELGKISVLPIPYRFLTEIKLTKNLELITNNQNLKLKTDNITVVHPNPSVYKVQINHPILENTTLVLSQSYHEGWNAYEITNNQAPNSKWFDFAHHPESVEGQFQITKFLKYNLPFLFGEKLEHVKVNNWENGWMLQDDRMTVNSKQSGSGLLTNDYHSVILVFWPQYLEYGGFGLLFVTIVILLNCHIVRKSKDNSTI